MNIVVITPYYPLVENKKLDGQTNVVHYFTKYWVKSGHKVLVIHTCPHKLIDSVNIFRAIASLKYNNFKLYQLDGVDIALIEWYRWKPGSFYLFNIQKKNTLKFVDEAILKWGYKPDRIVCHFPSECNWLMKELKDKYKCPQIGTFHTTDINLLSKNPNKDDVLKEFSNIYSKLGFRSINLLNEFENKFSCLLPKFIANSGIPDEIISNKIKQYDTDKKRLRLIYAGRLIKRKQVDKVLFALAELKDKYEFEFIIIGEGPEAKNLKSLCEKLNLTNHVSFLGSLKREAVFKELKNSDVFIMPSKKETFGLVYLEAMSQGCITIGSYKTGIDGIIVNGYNGFLVNNDDYSTIIKTLELIFNLSREEKNQILINTYNTIINLTDSKMADEYINNIINIK